jgi:inorganic pyrophosphatase
VRREIEHFFEIYKELQGVRIVSQGWGGPAEARRFVTESRQRYLESKLVNTEANL